MDDLALFSKGPDQMRRWQRDGREMERRGEERREIDGYEAGSMMNEEGALPFNPAGNRALRGIDLGKHPSLLLPLHSRYVSNHLKSDFRVGVMNTRRQFHFSKYGEY